MGRNDWKSWLVVFFALPVVVANAQETRAPKGSPATPVVRTVVSEQSADGVTQKQMGLSFLKNLEDYTVARVNAKTRESLAAKGYPNAQVSTTAESVYVYAGPHKLAVVRLKQDVGSSQVFIAGIDGPMLKRVACISDAASPIPVSYGPCGDKIAEVFGHRIGQ